MRSSTSRSCFRKGLADESNWWTGGILYDWTFIDVVDISRLINFLWVIIMGFIVFIIIIVCIILNLPKYHSRPFSIKWLGIFHYYIRNLAATFDFIDDSRRLLTCLKWRNMTSRFLALPRTLYLVIRRILVITRCSIIRTRNMIGCSKSVKGSSLVFSLRIRCTHNISWFWKIFYSLGLLHWALMLNDWFIT